ncbi:hypothetical protein VTN02DRAFT_6562 [Thermoascus thermophilus]
MSLQIPDDEIEVDTSDDDSSFDCASLVDSNKSLASSVRDYNYENGRRYHAYRQGEYPFPNDQEEQERLDLIHLLFKMTIGDALYRAPISSSARRILDFGTGTGIWAIEMAELFPATEIIGTDLSPIQPTWAPSNCRFYIDDVESEWTYGPNEAFDYIHGRAMAGGIADWAKLFQRIYDHLRPGGWVELQEYEAWIHSDDGTLEQAPTIVDWQLKLDDASRRFGKQFNVAGTLKQKMVDAGFVNVRDDVFKVPIGPWAKDPRLKQMGRLALVSVIQSVEPFTLALFTRVLRFTCEEAQAYMAKVRVDLSNPACHLYGKYHFVYGQKPTHGDDA